MRLWIDECLSPTLVEVAQRRCEATCNKYRGLLHAKDPALYAVVLREEWVFVTNNEGDFRSLAAQAHTHPGLILLPQRIRSEQPAMLEAVLDHIALHSGKDDTLAAAWVTNRVVEYHDEDNTISADDWPPSLS